MRGGLSPEMTTTCVQGAIRPLGGYQTNMMMGPASPASAWQFHPVLPKREPSEHEERHDSGINSGSDFVSSSPGSDNSENVTYSSPMALNATHPPAYYSTPIPRQPVIFNGDANTRMISSHINSESTIRQMPSNLCTASDESNTRTSESNEDDALRRLQMSLEKNGFLPSSVSPKLSECSVEDDNKSDNDMEEYDEQGLRVPKVNSHGKVKTFKCKQCDFVAITKLDFWEHTKSHIKVDKLLTCHKCPFVTEYKHHLEYHLRNHIGSKPFKCNQCSYSCVNKSMLNSHLKSHSNIYQYRCSNCSYATKYCHSLKLHLRKYNHEPAMVLNPDGTPNPLPIIDVYGTRRGPKVKSHDQKSSNEKPPQKPEQLLPFTINQLMLNGHQQMQLPFPAFPFFAGFPGGLPNPLFMQNLEKLARERNAQSQHDEEEPQEAETEDTVLDLSKPEEPVQKNKRKGRAFRVSQSQDSASENEDDEDESTTMFSNVEVVENMDSEVATNEKEEESKESNNNVKEDYNCQYCKINFGDPVLYTMHMGYHGYKNPFTCNMCGEECKDKVSFFLHIARTPHS